jgi:catabolite regulation protein CreA
VPEQGGVAGALGVAEEVSDISLACRQVGDPAVSYVLNPDSCFLRRGASDMVPAGLA